MNIELLLKLIIIGLPIFGALLLARWGDEYAHRQRWLAAITLGVTGIAALTLFLVGQQFACVFLTGGESCAFDGLGSLSVFLLSLISASICLRREANDRHDYIFLLLLSSSWAAIVLPDNWVIMLFALSSLMIVVSRWTKARGASVGFVVSRNDYKDDWGPK